MIPFLVTLSAGLSAVLGAALVRRVRNTDFSAFSLSFATGIMLMVALGELLPEALESVGIICSLICVVAGALLSLILDVAIPHHHHHDEHCINPVQDFDWVFV